MIIGIAIAVAALVAIVALVWFIAKGSPRLTALWAVLLVLALAIGLFMFNLAGVYYRMPIGWIVALVASALVVIALFVLVGKSVRWNALRVGATVALLVAGLVLSTLALIAMPMSGLVQPAFQARGEQIAEAVGFEALWVPDGKLKTDYLPVDAIGDPVEGLSLAYEGFDVQERKAEGELSQADLEKILGSGQQPFDFELTVPPNATYEELEVDGTPALGVEFTLDAKGQPSTGGLPGKETVIRILAFSKDGVDVRIKSEGHMAYRGGSGKDERYDFVPPMTFEELAEVGASLAPLE